MDGVLRLGINLLQDTLFGISLEAYDSSLHLLDGTVSDKRAEWNQDMVPIDLDVRSGQTILFRIYAVEGDSGIYELEVNGPELWNGNSRSGNGANAKSWGDANNWTVDGQPDVSPADTDNLTFPQLADGVPDPKITLDGHRVANSARFQGDYGLSNGTLEVTSGELAVAAGASLTIGADGTISTSVRKTDSGQLIVDGSIAGQTTVSEGTLSGSGTLEQLFVDRDGTVRLEGSSGKLTVTGDASIAGSVVFRIDNESAGPLNVAGEIYLQPSSVLSIEIPTSIGQPGTHSHTVLQASGAVNGQFADVTSGEWAGGNDAEGHLGSGLFFAGLDYGTSPGQLQLELFQAAAGDANGDHAYDQFDIISVLGSAKYLTGAAASWTEGDWNHDGIFDSLDIVESLKTPNYLKGLYA